MIGLMTALTMPNSNATPIRVPTLAAVEPVSRLIPGRMVAAHTATAVASTRYRNSTLITLSRCGPHDTADARSAVVPAEHTGRDETDDQGEGDQDPARHQQGLRALPPDQEVLHAV